ncbi:hypothetical protein MKEN_00570900 [Mycena kentingensis (nom. inval.)]|nr:hypothetical protein MKEN_00570900 [Mycena kentingensis (nom. inval.)]
MGAPSFLFFLSLCPSFALSALVNLTIDDSSSAYFSFDVGTTNPPKWAAVTPEAPCTYCAAQPDGNFTHNSTWHDGSDGSKGSLTFQGTAVYIYGVDLAGSANISFSLDDQSRTSFHRYEGADRFVYDALLFSATDIQPLEGDAKHTLSWAVAQDSKTNGTVALFDYAVVTMDEADAAAVSASAAGVGFSSPSSISSPASSSSPASASSKSNTGPIAGGVIAGVFALAMLVAVTLLCLRRRRRQRVADSEVSPRPAPTMVQPFDFVSASSPPRHPVLPPLSAGSTFGGLSTRGHGTGTGTVSSTGSQSTQSPILPSRKILDTSWTSPSSASLPSPERDRATLAPTVQTGTLSTQAREAFLEDRLAILEAHVRELSGDPAAGAPPAYEPSRSGTGSGNGSGDGDGRTESERK